MRSWIKIVSFCFCLLLPLSIKAIDIPCDSIDYPVVCSFLNRYMNEIVNWDRTDVSPLRKMEDDKFVVLDGFIEDAGVLKDATSVNVVLHDDSYYDVMWQKGDAVLLHVAFPVQYELLLGMPQNEIEQHLQSYIESSPARQKVSSISESHLHRIAPNLFRTEPRMQYELDDVDNCSYFYKDTLNTFHYVCDSTLMSYTISNLFQNGLDRNYIMDVSQSIYGFKKINFSTNLQKWIDYCTENSITQYVAVEQELTDAIQVLIVAECKSLGFNHLLSVVVPRNILSKKDSHILVKINAFIPTHNISELYQQYKSVDKKKRIWEEK